MAPNPLMFSQGPLRVLLGDPPLLSSLSLSPVCPPVPSPSLLGALRVPPSLSPLSLSPSSLSRLR